MQKKWQLSKTAYLKGIQCAKHLWLYTHDRDKATKPDIETQHKFDAGHTFEDSFRYGKFPEGIHLKNECKRFWEIPKRTKELLSSNKDIVLFEAGIIVDKTLILIDILEKKDDYITLYEIKNTTKLSKVIMDDMELQYAIAHTFFGEKLRAFNVVYWEADSTDKRAKKRVVVKNKIDLLKDKKHKVENRLNNFKSVLDNEIPLVNMGEQCTKPYKCPFIEFCKKSKVNIC